MIRAWMVVLVMWAVPAQATVLCGPNVVGVQGGSPPGGPDFFAPTPTPTFGTRMSDPRWVGSSEVSHDDGTGRIADVRALVQPGSPATLYVSWRWLAGAAVPTDAALARIVFGIGTGAPSDAATTGQFFSFVPKITALGSTQTDGANTLAVNGSTISYDGNTITPATWTGDARLWTDSTASSDTKVWGVEATMPLPPSATGKYSFFYQIRTPVAASYTGTNLPLAYPPSLNVTSSGIPGKIVNWAELDVSIPCTSGVSLQQSDIGIMHASINTSEFKPGDGGNDVFAEPYNGSDAGVAAGALHANFRLAKWGAAIGDSPSWDTIPGGGNVVNAAPIAPGTKGPITFNYVLSKQDNCDFFNFDCAGLTRTLRNPDQCVQVELSGSSLVFSKSSAGNNMRFVSASVFEENPTLNVRRGATNANAEYDVYFVIERVNMPATGAPTLFSNDPEQQKRQIATGMGLMQASRKQGGIRDFTVDERASLLQLAAQSGARSLTLSGIAVPIEALGMPTFKVHVYQDAKTKTPLPGGGESVDLVPGVGFGYYVRHEGSLSGWLAELTVAGAVQLAPNLYKVHVGSGAPPTIHVRVEAAQAPTPSPALGGLAWWIYLLIALGILVVLIVVVRMARRP